MSERSSNNGPEDRFVLENQATREKTSIEGTITVGRGEERELVLDCVKCSRFHAEFRMEDGELWVEDQGSTNGTFVNNERVEGRSSLEHGDIVQFGDARFKVIDVERQPANQGGEATVLANWKDVVDMPDESAAGADKSPATDSAEDAEAGKPAESAPAAAPPSAEASEGIDPSIPRSWADADQLEQASHTSMLVMDEIEGLDLSDNAVDPAAALAEARKHVAADIPILVGLTDPVLGTMFELTAATGQEKWEIGRGQGADIEIDAESVSGRHCQLVHENGRWKIVNMMSVNGTFVNDRKVLSAYLQPGDVVRMGGVKLVFDASLSRKRRRRRVEPSPAAEGTGGGSWLTAPFRWLGRLFSRNKP